MFSVVSDGGKYVSTVNDDGSVVVERYRELWRTEVGDNYLLSLLYLVADLSQELESVKAELKETCADLDAWENGRAEIWSSSAPLVIEK